MYGLLNSLGSRCYYVWKTISVERTPHNIYTSFFDMINLSKGRSLCKKSLSYLRNAQKSCKIYGNLYNRVLNYHFFSEGIVVVAFKLADTKAKMHPILCELHSHQIIQPSIFSMHTKPLAFTKKCFFLGNLLNSWNCVHHTLPWKHIRLILFIPLHTQVKPTV